MAYADATREGKVITIPAVHRAGAPGVGTAAIMATLGDMLERVVEHDLPDGRVTVQMWFIEEAQAISILAACRAMPKKHCHLCDGFH